MERAQERQIAATIHGRYLWRAAAPGAPVIVGFHGYAESADTQMARLEMIPGSAAWTLVALQGLHRFYHRRTDIVVASWMTRQDRELMIADNVAYVSALLEEIGGRAAPPPLLFAGFSQGVSMAFRAAVAQPAGAVAIAACGGDVPPELGPAELGRIGRVLIARGRDDRFYSDAVLQRDVDRLAAASVSVEPLTLDGGHEWTAEFAAAAGTFVRGLHP